MKKDSWNPQTSKNELDKAFKDNQQPWPKCLDQIQSDWDPIEADMVFGTLSAVFMYLKDILILNRVIETSNFVIYDPE